MNLSGMLPRVRDRLRRSGAGFGSGTESAIEQRKADHLSINLEQNVRSASTTSGLERYRFVHSCLPELDLQDVDTSQWFLGKRLAAPILISSMTGGVLRGGEINLRLARAAQEYGCAMGVGSQRAAIEHPPLANSFKVRNVAPDILLLANIGAVQLNYGYGIEECRRAVDMIEADALILHLNPVQEALQPDGNQNFSGLLQKIETVCRMLGVPVIVKEIGFGVSAKDAKRLAEAGVAAIDVAGAGGTSWSAVERFRAADELHRQLGETFTEWGIPTATSLRMAHDGAPDLPLIASGGLKSGLDAAKVLALGAHLAGFAGPLLKAADAGDEQTHQTLRTIIEGLRLSMFASGSRTVQDLKNVELMIEQSAPQFRRHTESGEHSMASRATATFFSTPMPRDNQTQPELHEGYQRHAI